MRKRRWHCKYSLQQTAYRYIPARDLKSCLIHCTVKAGLVPLVHIQEERSGGGQKSDRRRLALGAIEVRVVGPPSPSDGKAVANRGDDYAYEIGGQILDSIARRPYPVAAEQALVD